MKQIVIIEQFLRLINEWFKEQIRPIEMPESSLIWGFKSEPIPGEPLIPAYLLVRQRIYSTLPLFDLEAFKADVWHLSMTVTNPGALKNVLQKILSVASDNIQIYNDELREIEYCALDGINYNGIEIRSIIESRQIEIDKSSDIKLNVIYQKPAGKRDFSPCDNFLLHDYSAQIKRFLTTEFFPEALDANEPSSNKAIIESYIGCFSGERKGYGKLMSNKDYTHLLEKVTELAETGVVPKKIRKLPSVHGLTNDFIRHTFYRMHKEFASGAKINREWIKFMKAVFSQFDDVTEETLLKKFSTYSANANYEKDKDTISKY